MRSSLEKTNKEQEASYKVKRRTVDLLPDADDNLTKLEVRLKTFLKDLFPKKFVFYIENQIIFVKFAMLKL